MNKKPFPFSACKECVSTGGADIVIDDALSETSTNPAQNKVVTAELKNKIDEDRITKDKIDIDETWSINISGMASEASRAYKADCDVFGNDITSTYLSEAERTDEKTIVLSTPANPKASTLSAVSAEYADNNFANALCGSAKGEIVAIDDVSPIEHRVSVKASRKNLLDISRVELKPSKANVSLDGDRVTITGYLTFVAVYGLEAGKKYTYSWKVERNSEYGGGFALEYFYKDGTRKLMISGADHSPERSPYTFTMGENVEYIYLYFYGGKADADTPTTATYYDVQLEEGTTATAYTPYVSDLSGATVKTLGKNLINNDTSLIKQVTYINTSGTENTRYGYEVPLPIGTYTIRSIPKEPLTSNYYIYGCVVDENNVVKKSVTTVANQILSTVTFNIEKGDMLKIYDGNSTEGLSASKQRLNNFNIQLEAGETATDYEPYIEPISYPVAEDGKVEGVKSIYPNMTIATDTQGVVVDCNYNKDANKVIEKLTNAIISLGGNV